MTKKPAPSLPACEVQALADLALAAWESGARSETFDSLGDHWEFEPVRDANSRLIVRRFTAKDPADSMLGEKLAAGTHIGAFEFGVESARVLVTSRVQAVATPAESPAK